MKPIIFWFNKTRPKTFVKTVDSWLASNQLRVFEALLLKHKTKKEFIYDIELEKEKEISRQNALKLEGKSADDSKLKPKIINDKEKSEIVAFYIVSVVWSVGAVLEENGRKLFET